MGGYSAVVNFFRIFFIVLNCIFWILGLAIFCVGVWLVYLQEETDYDVITGSTIVSGAALLVLAGGVTLVVSAVGIVGAYGMWRPVLVIYMIAVTVIVTVEVVAGSLGFTYRDEVNEGLENRMLTAVMDYRLPGDEDYREEVNDAVDYVQDTFECCGVNSTFDWLEYHPDIFATDGNQPPHECLCNADEDDHCMSFNFTYIPPGVFVEQRAEFDAWDRGCLSLVEDNLHSIAISVGILSIIVGIIEFAGVVMAVGLWVCIVLVRRKERL